MFEDALMESGGRVKGKSGRWMAVTFIIEACIVIVLVLIPLIYPEALPAGAMDTILIAPAPPPPPPPPPPPAPKVQPQKIQSELLNNELRAPSKIPKDIKMVKEEAAPPSTGGGVFGGIGGGSGNGVIGGMGLATSNTNVVRAAPKGPVRISSGVIQGNKIAGADPVYPQIAKAAHVTGSVVIDAVISKSGTIENLQVVSGPPLLRDAALSAVRTWRYKPYILNGEPTQVQTTISVNFTFGGG